MAAYCSSPSASSSAVTIPTPGKSILKRPPPPQQSLFSRLSKFLPTNTNSTSGASTPQGTQEDETRPLKRAHFILPEIAIVYPISSVNPPSMPFLKDEKRAIEDKEYERRRRVVKGQPKSPGAEPEGWWNMEKVESFYRECCEGCDEVPDPGIGAAFKNAAHTSPRTVDLSGVQITITSASILSDVFTIEWGLNKLVFRECDLDELTLKPILHSLLISGTLSFLSVASNRRLKTPAFRLIGAYIKKAKSLRFLDLSQNNIDKKSIEYIVAALGTPPDQGLESLRLDDCILRPAALEALCRAVRTSSLKHISLRHNRISSAGGVALALMIRDYPDTVSTTISISPTPSYSGTPASSATSSPTASVSSLPLVNSPPGTPTANASFNLLPPSSAPVTTGGKTGPVLPPPRHPLQSSMQTTYTPYIPRNKRRGGAPPTTSSPLSPTPQHIPIITSSSQGGVTTRHLSATSGHRHDVSFSHSSPANHSSSSSTAGARHDTGPSAALLDRVRALDTLPRLGALRTLDLKGNDLRNGITYLAQVLKRNRTLKLLNLSENKLDVGCLVAIAEALKYNSCLETLDMSKNPCSGPSLDGIQSLRTAFTLNTSLKRLFLSSTHLTSPGAIALAEFLPESTSLLHLDLTNNHLDLAGIMALNKGLKSNHVMRCLDLNIPPGDEAFAKMCREILNTCVRNTEEAERSSKTSAPSSTTSENPPSVNINTPTSEDAPTITTAAQIMRGKKRGVWGLIEDSALARSIRKDEEKKMESDVLARARNAISQLSQFLSQPLLSPIPPSPSTPLSPPITSPATFTPRAPRLKNRQQSLEEITTASAAMIVELRTAIQETAATEDTERLALLLGVNDELLGLMKRIPSLETGATSGVNPGAENTSDNGVVGKRPRLVLQGLGLSFDGNTAGSKPASEAEKSEQSTDVPPILDIDNTNSSETGTNGPDSTPAEVQAEGEEDLTPTTPRIDKGKGRAEPEEEEPEKVLSPSYVIDSDSDENDEGRRLMTPEELAAFMPSPTERSRSWVEEEGEVFRKGTVLLGPEELEGEYDGEELRKELLEAMVERPPPRAIDEFGMDGVLIPDLSQDPFNTPLSPTAPSVGSPTVQSPAFDFSSNGNGLSSPTEQPSKPPPRPYIPRRSSASTTSSIMGVISPTIGASTSPNPGSSLVGGSNENEDKGSPNALAHVPMFVKRTRSVDSAGSGSTVS
ncbi:hypothetical protein D9756_006991 [Leucocoprinus leucothites]|uniref:RNI-like protein n=1 Tax=Leucocoprinus leucothites TaxID=201217 RepID=A0A8H5D680_9AGAR|nr:hypothetical protein D9756_006991 [Leucoagaricus leucothites]